MHPQRNHSPQEFHEALGQVVHPVVRHNHNRCNQVVRQLELQACGVAAVTCGTCLACVVRLDGLRQLQWSVT